MSRHAAPRKFRGGLIAVVVAIVVVAAVIGIGVLATSSGGKKTASTSPSASPSVSASPTSSCPQVTTVRVVAASGIAPVVQSVASKLTCVRVTVSVNDSATAATLLKSGKADVWIPDSRVRAVLAGKALTSAAPSVAISPIVIAANSSLSTSRFGKSALTWNSLLDRSSLSGLSTEIQNNTTSSTSLVLASALNGLALKSTGDKYLGLASTAAASTGLKSVSTNAIGSSALRVEEARLVQGQPSAKILPMNGGYPQLDYPWLARSGASTTVQTATTNLLALLQGSAGDAARKQQGLLNPGTLAVEPGDYAGTSSGVLIASPTVDTIPTLYAIADAGAAHGNTLAVLDISGSMSESAGDGQPSKIDAVKSSGKLAAQLLSDQTQLGLWEFTYHLDGDNDYRQVVPLAPLSKNRSTLLDALNAATPIPTGGTSLYRTTINAYKFVQDNWKANYANTVIVFTDGKDETDPGAPSLADAQSQLKSIADPKKPIQLIMLGYGDADISSMNALTATIGGVVYHITNSTQIVGAFIDSISQSVLKSLGA